MRIVIVGPGAMGCLFGAFLAKFGEDIYLLDRRDKRAEYINKNGIKVEGISGEFKIAVKATSNPSDIGECALVIICVKSYDTEAAIKSIKSIIKKDTLVLTLQNGVGNVEAISKIAGEEKTIGGVTSHGATLLGDGHIRHAGKGETVIGMAGLKIKSQASKKLDEIAKVFERAGFQTKLAENIENLIWSKLVINIGINALTAITRLNNGRLIEFAGTEAILEEAVREAIYVADAKGIKLIFDDPVKKVKDVANATGGNVSSMLQDVLKKRKTEIDYMNGAIVREAGLLKIDVPVNRMLTNLVKTIEASYSLRVG